MSDKIRVFISYSHDSDEHEQRVLALSERLRTDGIDAQVDQYINGTPPKGWPRWMADQLDEAEYVLLICTETYYRRFRGHEQPGKGKGADWEGALITQDMYDVRSDTIKFVPILFDPSGEQYVPQPLRSLTHYTIDSEADYERLYEFLLGEAGVEPGALGDVRRKGRKRGAALTFPAERAAGARESAEAQAQLVAFALPQKISPTRLRHSAETLIGREADLTRLDEAWADPATHVLTIVAFGGVGKTSLVAHWAARLAQRGYDGAWYFDWSFYSQGTREQGGASADQFINRALEFFGDAELAASAASPWDKGARLAQLGAERRALLVLDGLEPLQYPPSHPMKGELRDPVISALLKGLAQRNPGLCVVTTRERVSDLTPFRASTAPELPLERLLKPAGIDLLRTLGVRGSEKEMETLVEDVQGHALTLNLLGRYLVRAHGGDIRRRDRVRFEKADTSIQGGHAFKAMAAYETWLADGGEEGARQLAILRLMGLFDRPADAACLDALRRQPTIAGLTDPIVDLEEEDWNLAVAALGDCGLVSVPEADPGALDAHPLIREYFAEVLREHAPEAWREAHSRLYEHLRDSVEHRPDSLDGLQPLYQAVAHGCHAQRHQEVCDSIYWERILRGTTKYSTNQLGAFGADLGAVACFFDQPWTKVSPLFTVREQAWLLSQAAFRMRALGRLSEALKPMGAGLEMYIDLEAWAPASITAGNLSELELTLGNVDSAVADAEQAVTHADRSGDTVHRMAQRAIFAGTLLQTGRRDDARTLFLEAEALQAERQPYYPLLYSLPGFLYCDMLLTQPEWTAWRSMIHSRETQPDEKSGNSAEVTAKVMGVIRRGQQMLDWRRPDDPLLDIALDHLTLGRALLYQSVVKANASAAESTVGTEPLINPAAQDHLDAAVNGFRRAGTIHNLPWGLLSRAWRRFLRGEHSGARADLNEAWEIAERGPMKLHMADIQLYRARLFHAVQPYPWGSPHADLAAARKLIEECGYWRRKEELEDAEAAAENW